MKDDQDRKSHVSRRDFLKITTAGVGAAALTGALTAPEAEAQVKIPKKWDKEVDVVVIGAGYAGLAAAIEAKDAGASVMLLEKMANIGGNSVIAGGVYNAVDPEQQGPRGIKDSVDLHYQQTLAGGDFRADPAKVRYYTENSLSGWKWLEGFGVKLDKFYQVYGALHPRSHGPAYRGKKAGGAIISAEYDQAKSRNIPVLTEYKLTRIYREQPLAGRVIGVEAENKGKKMNIRAKKGVVLASGGFLADVEMRMRHDPRWNEKFGTTNHPGATGESLNMAQDIGAEVIGIDFFQSIGPTGPDVRYVKGATGSVQLIGGPMMRVGGLTVNYCIYTDLRGNRIIASDARRDQITEAILRTPEQVTAGIGDDTSRRNADVFGETPIPYLEKLMKERPKEVFRGDTIRELAMNIGMPDPAVLEETVRKYNSFVDAKKDPEFGQLPHNLTWKCEKPPFWTCTASPALHHMCGGLRTKSISTVVLDRWNKPIPGLFAAGEITGGVHGTNRLGGNATGDCIVFGRLAGKEAAAEKPAKKS